MLTNRRSTMMIPPARAPSWRPEVNLETEPRCKTTSILTATTDSLPGYRINKVIGTVHGITVCARKDTKAFLKAAGTGSEAKSLTHTLYNARDQAMERMIRDCISRGGNAVVGMSFGESEVLGFAQVSVYGTAVFVEKEGKAEDCYTLK
ncbi:DUF74-domain-containing protein [Lindgomyces ingoldianus]|uniref:DUF74-domain-containing protein n=1 Tax=Lindgomyces ingoldianus TaxID=673940 RepID=A0ACB6QRP9_9PLEO|nr:DUF74-domain-containing protein [Lindgomyces ingoldianus]KAF2469560.1 DUF74-domain-containing protein [Lindgomyces ingoldianus]